MAFEYLRGELTRYPNLRLLYTSTTQAVVCKRGKRAYIHCSTPRALTRRALDALDGRIKL